jgi:acetyl-CoA acetyltransferase
MRSPGTAGRPSQGARLDIDVVGLAISPPSEALQTQRLEELAFDTVRAALERAGVDRREIDAVTLAASDEMDGRSITSMLMAAPSGAYLKDEIRVTDSGMTGLVLGALRVATGRFRLGLVVSWNQTSVIDVEGLMRMRAEPFYLRPVGLNATIAEGLAAGAVQQRLGVTDAEVSQRVAQRQAQAAANPRGLRRQATTPEAIAASAPTAWPLRAAQQAPASDGCVAFVLASPGWMASRGGRRPLARLKGLAWGVDRYALDDERLGSLALFERKFDEVLERAGRCPGDAVDLVELEAQTGWDDIALARRLEQRGVRRVSPSGGVWAQNPLFCTGLVNAAEAVLQLDGSAGAVQVPDARFAVAHGSHGFAQQGHVFAAFERITA